ncbi:MAG: transcription termination factor Rho [Thermodesulfobacteriota bacterium]
MEEKDLAKMTASKLVEEVLKIPGLTGVHAMKKAELIAAIRQAKGWVDKKEEVKDLGVKELKLGIAKLRAEREAVRESGDRKKLRLFRIGIKKLKRRTRRLTRAKA